MSSNSRPNPRPESPSTVHDLAEHAGVSAMTVSRALSGNGYVAKSTREKVLAAAEVLGYVPNISAKVLKRTRTNVLGMLVTELRSPHIAQVISAVSAATQRAGQDLFICLTAADPTGQSPMAIKHLMSGICDGLIMALPKMPQATLEMIERSGLPAVLLDYAKGSTQMAVVRGDNYDSSRAAVEHLLGLGHRRIAFLAGSGFTGQSPERERGYADALRDAGIDIDPTLIAQGEFHQGCGFERSMALLALPRPPTAVFAANDEMALGVMDAARASGLRVPDDLSIIGFDDIPTASLMQPGLTTIRQATDDIADAAVRTLMRQIDTRTMSSERIEFPSRLIVRGSTGPLNPAAR